MTISNPAEKTRTMTEKMRQFSSFRLNGRLYGVDILNVKEVSPELSFTPIFHAPPELKGCLNIRGQIHLVIDISLLLGFQETKITKDSSVVLFKKEVGEAFGILVDAVGDVIELPESMIEHRRTDEQPAENEEHCMEISIGTCKLQKELMEIINPACLLKIIEDKTTQDL